MTSSSHGPPENDYTIEAAKAQFAVDVRRLNQHHIIESWAVLPDRSLHLVCGCDHRRRNADEFRDHAMAARGPIRK